MQSGIVLSLMFYDEFVCARVFQVNDNATVKAAPIRRRRKKIV